MKQQSALTNNSKLVIFGFFNSLLFEITAYKSIWAIELISKLVNTATITLFTIYSLYSVTKRKNTKNIFIYYLLPGFLIYIGYFTNITINTLTNTNIINQYGLLIPWAVYLSIPSLVKLNKLNMVEYKKIPQLKLGKEVENHVSKE